MKLVSVILINLLWCQMALAKDLVLLTGFDPFAGKSSNNSWVIAEKIKEKLIGSDIEIVTCLLPTSYTRAVPTFQKCLQALEAKPTLVISLGEGPCNVKWETRAHNRDHDKGPDNDGISRKRQIIDPTAPSELGLRLNYASMYCELTEQEKKLTWISTDPQNFVCNNTAFRISHSIPDQLYGFIHVPETSCEKKTPGITQRATDLVSKMILNQLSVRNSTTSRIDWPSELNTTRLQSDKNSVKNLKTLSVESCEQEFIDRWRKDF
ncbi:MAG: hypothetical protein K2P81_05285 [Bacteriovoracaceae bacterium]|nr:hypothetical protein [Bacteriovoracaceae bacterium]